MKYKIIILLIPIVITGCASLTSPARKHEIAVEDGKSYWFDYDASRRGALMIPKDRAGHTGFKICSEPAPDIAFDTISKFESKLDYEKLGAEAAGELTSKAVKLAERGQTIQFLRESLFRLCELSINTELSPATLQEVYVKILDTALRLSSDKPFELDAIRLQEQIARARAEESKANADIKLYTDQIATLKSELSILANKHKKAQDAAEIESLKAELNKKELELAQTLAQLEKSNLAAQQAKSAIATATTLAKEKSESAEKVAEELKAVANPSEGANNALQPTIKSGS